MRMNLTPHLNEGSNQQVNLNLPESKQKQAGSNADIDENESNSSSEQDRSELKQTLLSPRLKELTWDELLELYYQTGGIPRYLYDYAFDLNHERMEDEVAQQIADALNIHGSEKVLESVVTVAISHDVYESAVQISYAVWIELELLTFFMLCHVDCFISNCRMYLSLDTMSSTSRLKLGLFHWWKTVVSPYPWHKDI